jgi:hypothetical protein
MKPKQWMFAPDSGGKKISPAVQMDVKKRILVMAEKEFKGKYTRLDIHFRGQFCYIDAYTEPILTDSWPPADWGETRQEYAERLRNTPTHLCRLRYFGNDEWGFAFYTYSHEKYEFALYDNGQSTGKPESAFLLSANAYLNE